MHSINIISKMMFSKKHLIEDENQPEEYVKVVYANLVKEPKTEAALEHQMQSPSPSPSQSTSQNNIDKFESSAVIVNGKVYQFNLKSLMEKEPTTNLLNMRAGTIKKKVNKGNLQIEYMEQIPDFNLVIDYINGYDYKNFDKVFRNNHARFECFRLLLTKLEMPNLLKGLNVLFPILNVNGIMHTVSAGFINTLEPHNKLFANKYTSYGVFAHFRDREIYSEYFRDYLLGKKTLLEAAEYIKRLQNPSVNAGAGIGTENEYLLAKIMNDLDYYGLHELRKAITPSNQF